VRASSSPRSVNGPIGIGTSRSIRHLQSRRPGSDTRRSGGSSNRTKNTRWCASICLDCHHLCAPASASSQARPGRTEAERRAHARQPIMVAFRPSLTSHSVVRGLHAG
jgi:hypothetical protein